MATKLNHIKLFKRIVNQDIKKYKNLYTPRMSMNYLLDDVSNNIKGYKRYVGSNQQVVMHKGKVLYDSSKMPILTEKKLREILNKTIDKHQYQIPPTEYILSCKYKGEKKGASIHRIHLKTQKEARLKFNRMKKTGIAFGENLNPSSLKLTKKYVDLRTLKIKQKRLK